jgi:hypothetical protein
MHVQANRIQRIMPLHITFNSLLALGSCSAVLLTCVLVRLNNSADLLVVIPILVPFLFAVAQCAAGREIYSFVRVHAAHACAKNEEPCVQLQDSLLTCALLVGSLLQVILLPLNREFLVRAFTQARITSHKCSRKTPQSWTVDPLTQLRADAGRKFVSFKRRQHNVTVLHVSGSRPTSFLWSDVHVGHTWHYTAVCKLIFGWNVTYPSSGHNGGSGCGCSSGQ